ncbi:HTH-type transcriptional repressor KstR2 (plasmid) [Variovorax sp. SRS16]|uniref:TetR/AcrR family transcriptional regulator n=1 Tax=Variovorax sp. SRS16 TaxID=282217 RepID=UPI0013185B93|nr:TetR/AcrR family transcriptional regulator [Variovorax sp. SRS16]VTU46353.1 HTH-type transcriptional repressor KstR2 [Variovorax sp. SRS16]
MASGKAARGTKAIKVDAVEDRPTQLIEIASRLFAARGYAGTSLRDIAEEARVTKAALYYHFPNKEALYEQIVVDSLQALIDRVSEAVVQAGSATEKVCAFMLSAADVFAGAPDAWIAGSNVFWSSMGPQIRAAAVGRRDKFEKLLRSCIAEGVASGEFRKVDPAIAGRLLLSTLNQMTRWIKRDGPLTPRQVIEQYLEIILIGMRTHEAQTTSRRRDSAVTTIRSVGPSRKTPKAGKA